MGVVFQIINFITRVKYIHIQIKEYVTDLYNNHFISFYVYIILLSTYVFRLSDKF